ncbi:retrovirus-related pol polyprotein from transposon TNT 1-94, partial [Tanacetum coccineum]
GVDLLTGSRGNNLYTLSLGDMMASSPICLLSKASKTKSWLWHRRLSHLNFGAINHLARHGLVRGLPKLKFKKDHLCSACVMGKSKKKPHKPKSKDTNQEKLYLLHMDLCGPMRVASVNGKKYILVIIDDYSRFTWVKCLRSKDEALDFIIKFLKMIQKVGISHETFVARSLQQNDVVERRNRTLIEAGRTMLIYAKASLFLWAEAVATACYTQNRSIVRLRHGKTPYELLHDKLPDLSFFHVFGPLGYPTNDSENLGKLQPKADIGIFIGYAPTKKEFQIYNRCTRRIIETIHVDFDELTDLLFQPLFDELLTPPPNVDHPTPEVIAPIAEVVAPELAVLNGSPSSTIIDQNAPSPSNSQITPKTKSHILPNDVEEENHGLDVAHMNNDPLCEHVTKWTKDHPLNNIISELERPVSTRLQLYKQALFCYYDAFLSSVEPKTYKDALTQSCWIEAMQEELNEFEHLEVWELVPRPDTVMVITLKWIYKVKLDELGGILKNKARLVARGYRQEEGIDFECKDDILERHSARRSLCQPTGQEFSKGTVDPTLFIRRQGKDLLLILQSPRGIFINQSKYALESLKKYGMESSDPVHTPMVEKSKLDEDTQRKAVDHTHYRGMIGTLMYLTASRPDLTFDVCMCARLLAGHQKGRKALRYLVRKLNILLCLAVVLKSLWMRSQLTDYGLGFNKIPMYCDNKSAIALCCNNVQHSRSKHIDIRFHFIKEQVENGVVELYFVNTEYQLADIFTKALCRERIEFLINKLGMRSFTPETLKQLADEVDE